jgi:predicted GNAT family acetyltransferase
VTGAAVRIDRRYGPFAAACDYSDKAQGALAAMLSGPEDTVWLVEPHEWPAPPGTRVLRAARLLQMVAEAPQPPQPDDGEIVALGDTDVPKMTALALATEPGPWGSMTHRYGQFWGIREDGRLLAMAGERMLPAPGLAELSGVCTWPDCRGRGLAAKLIRRVMTTQAARGDTPYLHSYAGNAGAIRLYESLGFRPSREMVATVLALA